MKFFSQIANLLRSRHAIANEKALPLNCCNAPRLNDRKTDLGHAESFEYMHATCKNCGSHWLEIFCVANGISGVEKISTEQADLMLSKAPGPEKKAVMKAWGREHL